MAVSTDDFIKQIDEMTVLELNNLVKALEDHYGVSAAAATVASMSSSVWAPETNSASNWDGAT